MSDGSALLDLLGTLVEYNGSDLFLVTGLPPSVRVGGVIHRLPIGALSGAMIEDLVTPHVPEHALAIYRATGVADCALIRNPRGRFRCNLHHERGQPSVSIRALPMRPPSLSELGFPPAIRALSTLPYGLVLVGGATGSGKTTTLAALVDEINQRDAKHIITIEDPIEYEHVHQRSIVEQIEIGSDAVDFPTALRSALRQAPDVIVVGEMRDPETMRIALAAGETGHLVFSTLHASDVAATVARISDSFSDERQATVRDELAIAAAAVMTQMLLPRVGGGRVPAAELLMVSYAARQHIRKNALQHLNQEITFTRPLGSFTFEECLARLVKAGSISVEDARSRARHPKDLENLLH